jgi:hypothetical protein
MQRDTALALEPSLWSPALRIYPDVPPCMHGKHRLQPRRGQHVWAEHSHMHGNLDGAAMRSSFVIQQ